MDIIQILSSRFEDSVWTLDGEEYEGLTWLDDSPKPTKKELEALWPEVQSEVAHERVERARATAYRETSDPIFFRYQRGSAPEQDWLEAVQKIKDENPYPEPIQ
jgi:hypothetical protein